jgi:deazaflavin-dependent oxidoreductase (nitroreductase family)
MNTPPIDASTRTAMDKGGVIDIATIGAKSGSAHRIEIVFHHFDGHYYITGKPGFKRDWLANLKANPEFTLHLITGPGTNISARAAEVTDRDERATVLYRILTESWGNEPAKADHILPQWVEGAPLVSFTLT